MKGKGISLLLILGVVFVFAGVSMANVPPPPANQTLGFPDVEFDGVSEAECRVCHTDTVDGHHLLYSSVIPLGLCSYANGTCSEDGVTPCIEDADCTGTCDPLTPGTCISSADCAQPLFQCNINGQPCPVGLCDDGVTSCQVDGDCVVPGDTCNAGACPQSWTGQYCSDPICYGESAVVDTDADDSGTSDTNYGCLNCHLETNVGGVIGFEVERDCTVCHVQGLNQPTVHHANPLGDAKNGVCTTCHGDLVDDALGCAETTQNVCSIQLNDVDILCEVDADCTALSLGTCVSAGGCDHDIPTYTPSLVTPSPSLHGEAICDDGVTPCPNGWECGAGTCIQEPNPAGGCNYCHDAGFDTASGKNIHDNYDTHHHSGIYKNKLGGSNDDICLWCHKTGHPHEDTCSNDRSIECISDGDCPPGGVCETAHDADIIRTCENCHGYESLHNIQADSPNAGNIGSIVVGAEDAYYGHVGRDNPADPMNDSDCWGCHGFSTASAPATGPIVPSLNDASVSTITAGAATAVTLTGAAFTNDSFTSQVEISGADGSIVVTPDTISVGSLTVIIPALDAGIYDIRVKKEDVVSNPIAISCVPAVAIDSVDCTDGTLTVTGSGFGDTPPEGTEEYLNVEVSGVPVVVISWTNTEIVADVFSCSGTVTVNALFGSANTEGSDCEVCAADCNNDGTVDLFDLIILITEFGRTDCNTNTCRANFDGNGRVDIFDLVVMKLQFLKGDCCLQ